MKKTFSKWIQTLTTAITPDASTQKRPLKREKKSSAPKSKKLAMEHLEDRCMLSAASITFNQLQDFTYQPPGAGSTLSFGLERTHFLELAKIGSLGKDIVSIDRDLHTVSVFLNQGTSTYAPPVKTVISGLSGSSKSFALADMNNDGIADLLVLYPKQVTVGGKTQTDLIIDVYQGSLTGTFSTTGTQTQISNPFKWDGTDNDIEILSVQLRNVVGDHYPDLLVTLKGTSWSGSSRDETTNSFLYVGRDKGFVTTADAIAVPSTITGDAVGFANVTSNASSLQLISQTETVTSGKSVQSLYFYNTTVTSNSISVEAAGKKEYPAATPLWTKIANVDQRPGDEIITGVHYIDSNNQSKFGVRVSYVTGSLPQGNIEAPINAPMIDVDIEPRYCAIGDMNNDGYIDILISDGTSYQFLVGTSTGQFQVQSKIDSFANYLAVQAGDFNGDGHQDIVAVGEKHLMFLPGNPSHPAYNKGEILLTFTARVTHAVFGDFTGDGYIDFVVAQGDAGVTLTLYTGLAPGSGNLFQKFMTITEASSPSTLVAGSFMTKNIAGTLNPKTDLAVLHNSGKDILVISFDGAQAATTNITLPAAITGVVHIAAGDFNGDGYDDLIVVNEEKATVTVLKNNGDGTFDLNGTPITVGTPLNITTQVGSKPCFVAVADINGDGRLDFAVLNAGDNEVRFYTQNANGTFVQNTATARLTSLNLKPSVRNYQMIFEDFDMDGRIDLLVGVTGTNQAMIFQNKGTQSGQFSSEVSWVGMPQSMILEGSLNSQTVFAMSTGFKTGSKNASGYDNKTPGVVLVSGNKIYRFENTTVSEMSPGSMEIVFREFRGTVLTPNPNQYDTIPAGSAATNDPRLTWLHEWGHYYLEVWGSSGIVAESISTFNCTINYDKTLFSATTLDIDTVPANFTLNSKAVDTSAGQIIVSGTSVKTGVGNNLQYVLLFRVFISPATNTSPSGRENVGVRIPDNGYATPVSSGFLFDVSTAQINSKNLVNLTDGRMMPVYPVIYDLNDDGHINLSDFAGFVSAWGKTVENVNSATAKWDFDHNGTIGMNDFTNFVRTWQKKRGDIFLHTFFPGNFPVAWPQLASANIPEPSADLLEASVPTDTFAVEDFLEPVVQDEKITIAFADNSYTIADVVTAENDCVDVKSADFTFSGLPSFEFTSAASLSVSELDTLGYVARTESVFNSERKRIETLDQVLGELFQDEDEALTLEEVFHIAEQPFESLRLNDQILTEMV